MIYFLSPSAASLCANVFSSDVQKNSTLVFTQSLNLFDSVRLKPESVSLTPGRVFALLLSEALDSAV